MDSIYEEYKQKINHDIISLQELKQKNPRLLIDLDRDIQCKIKKYSDLREFLTKLTPGS